MRRVLPFPNACLHVSPIVRLDLHLLNTGKVLIAGGWSSDQPTTVCELFDTASSTWSTTESLPAQAVDQTLTLLADGRVLLDGWANTGSTTASTAIYDPRICAWTVVGSAHEGHRRPQRDTASASPSVLGPASCRMPAKGHQRRQQRSRAYPDERIGRDELRRPAGVDD